MTQDELVFVQSLKNTLQVAKLLLADKEIAIHGLTQENNRLGNILRLPPVAKAVGILQKEAEEAQKEAPKVEKKAKKKKKKKP